MLEDGAENSLTIREILRQFHRVEVGLYSVGPCMLRPKVLNPCTHVGRYSILSDTVRTFTRNHPMNTMSTHGFFENPALGKAKIDLMQFGSLHIGNGVRIGHNVIILPPTERIGNGAIITPGAVVCGNVPPYAIVSGFPAYVKGYRFDKDSIADLLASRWWEKTPAELRRNPPLPSRARDARPEASRPPAGQEPVTPGKSS